MSNSSRPAPIASTFFFFNAFMTSKPSWPFTPVTNTFMNRYPSMFIFNLHSKYHFFITHSTPIAICKSAALRILLIYCYWSCKFYSYFFSYSYYFSIYLKSTSLSANVGAFASFSERIGCSIPHFTAISGSFQAMDRSDCGA